MKKVLDVKLLETGIIEFSDNEGSVPDEALRDKIRMECNPYLNGENDGVLFYMTEREYQAYQKLYKLMSKNV